MVALHKLDPGHVTSHQLKEVDTKERQREPREAHRDKARQGALDEMKVDRNNVLLIFVESNKETPNEGD
eukprot:CAMPEP_0114558224 /NCGR_PEP_ID=MMETSP0114-20121206/10257_1 /TAXON_ID=31324 /ORGANISM="Goniomonas sp, Strain m" /LENGTH=68 /DNA_ID=CAMNT_0001743579 /DNA_START=227 /DNA_END=433 /DNA_ORIENTATION=-